MNKALKRILPILLGIVIICSILWYLFSYDRAFTRDMLLWNARYFEAKGNHSISAWFYDQAYLHSGKDEQVAIELAEKFKDEKVTTIDGVKIDFADGWVHLRKSNTEPIIRVYSEGKTEAEAERFAQMMLDEAKKMM